MTHEAIQQKLRVKRQVPLPVVYKGIKLDCGYRMDMVVEDLIVVGFKTVEGLLPVHEAQPGVISEILRAACRAAC